MNEVVSAYGEAVSVAGNLPDCEPGIHYFRPRCDSCCASMDGLHGVSVDIVGQTA